MNLILSIIAAVSFISYVYTLSTDCSRDDEKCLHYEQCPLEIQDMIAMRDRPLNVTRWLMNARCGERHLKKMCCNTPPPPPPQPECYTWDGRPGECVEWKQVYRNMTRRQGKISRCTKKKETFTVCYSNSSVIENSDCKPSAFPTDPSYGCCGRVFGERKLLGGNWIDLLDYPFLAVLKYEANRKNCTGVLISSKYVLTAASCVHPLSIIIKPYAVVLGEYDKSTKYDCSEVECRDSAIEETIGIEEIIIHEGFNPFNESVRDDIALIRLMKMANYSESIQPICLPIQLQDVTKTFTKNTRISSVGWAYISQRNHIPSDVIRHASLPIVDPYTCVMSYPRLTSRQMCAGGELNQSPCIIDYGSPLIYQGDLVTMEVLGITSYHNHNTCYGTPAVYTKVYPYLSWIHRHIRP